MFTIYIFKTFHIYCQINFRFHYFSKLLRLFFNLPLNSMDNSSDSFLKSYSLFNQDVALFEFGEVIVAKNYKENSQVRIVSGGSASHIEYVGSGMLTAAIQGRKNDLPTSSLILRTLRELSVNHVNGILVTVQGNSSDLLNFGLAVKRAENDDLRVRLLSVLDDCRNSQYDKSEKRGLSGIVLVNKIAGALALQNKSLADIYDYASKVVSNMISSATNVKETLSKSKECTYCAKCSARVDRTQSGKNAILKKLTVTDILSDIVYNLLTDISTTPNFTLGFGDSVVVFVNNMGSLSANEQYIFFKCCLEFLNKLNLTVEAFYIGSYLQIPYDVDLTVTVLRVFDKDVVKLLNDPCRTIGWKPVFQSSPISLTDNIMPAGLKKKCRLSPPVKGPKLKERASNVVQVCLSFACDALISCEKMLNKIDAEKGDGDTGTRLRIMAEVLNKRSCSNKLNASCPFTFFLTLSKLLDNTVGGVMGCLYSIMFESAANTFGSYSEDEEITAEMWLKALENACDAVKKYGNVDVGDNTLYDPLVACATLVRQLSTDGKFIYALEAGVHKAEEVAQATKRPGCKYPDAGAHAVGIWLRAVCEGVKLRCTF